MVRRAAVPPGADSSPIKDIRAASAPDAGFENPHYAAPRYDLDRTSYGVVKMLDGATGIAYPGMPWEPKQSFQALAAAYGHST